jgi:hypothetical protein
MITGRRALKQSPDFVPQHFKSGPKKSVRYGELEWQPTETLPVAAPERSKFVLQSKEPTAIGWLSVDHLEGATWIR